LKAAELQQDPAVASLLQKEKDGECLVDGSSDFIVPEFHQLVVFQATGI
jgi:hypothetical protein